MKKVLKPISILFFLFVFLFAFSLSIQAVSYCGDGDCNTNEDCETCPDDCNTCPSEPPPSPGSSDTAPCYSGECPDGNPYTVYCTYPGCGADGDTTDCCTASERRCWRDYECTDQACQTADDCDDVMNPVSCLYDVPGCRCYDKCGNVYPISHAAINCVDGVCVYTCYYCDPDQGGTNQPPSVKTVTPASGCSRRERITFEATYYDATSATWRIITLFFDRRLMRGRLWAKHAF